MCVALIMDCDARQRICMWEHGNECCMQQEKTARSALLDVVPGYKIM
jgi:hypothetical protein